MVDRVDVIVGAIVLLLSNLASIAVSVYLAISRQRGVREKEVAKVERDVSSASAKQSRDATQAAWDYAGKREAQHTIDLQNINLQLQAHRQELTELRQAERDCHAKAAAQETQIKFQDQLIQELREELEELKQQMSASGLRDRSDIHRALPPDSEVEDNE